MLNRDKILHTPFSAYSRDNGIVSSARNAVAMPFQLLYTFLFGILLSLVATGHTYIAIPAGNMILSIGNSYGEIHLPSVDKISSNDSVSSSRRAKLK